MKHALLVSLIALGFLFGCDSGETTEEPGEDTNIAVDTTVDAGNQTSCEGLPDLTGKSWRILTLKATTPTPELDPVWAMDIASYDLVLVFRVIMHDVETNELTMTVTSAKAVVTEEDGARSLVSYKYSMEPAQFSVFLDGCSFEITEPFLLNVITPTVSKPFPVEVRLGRGEFANGGLEIKNGYLEGGIRESEGSTLCLSFPGIGTANFHWFMNLARICPDHDLDGDGTIDSYAFTGTFNATQEDFFLEGIDPIEPIGGACDAHTDECIPK
jgi:hypothetical protein